MKQLLFTLLFIFGIYQVEAGRIIGVNCPYMQGGDSPRGSAEIIDGTHSHGACILTVNGEVHFGFQLKTSEQLSPLLLNNIFLRVKINDQIIQTIHMDQFNDTLDTHIYYYDYLFSCPDPLYQTIIGVTQFTLEVELLLNQNLWGNPNYLIPFPVNDYQNLFLEYDADGPPLTEFSADITSCNALAAANQFGFPIPRSPKLAKPKNAENPDKHTNFTHSEFGGLEISGNSFNETEISIFPNPFNEQININALLNNLSFMRLELFDLTGRRLLEKQVQSATPTKTLNTSILNPGVYICKITTENFEVSTKLLKQKN